MLSENHKLDVLAMVIADSVYQDRISGKYTILGTYNAIQAASFPYLQQTLLVFLSLAGEKGEVPIKVRLIDAEEKRPALFEIKGTIGFQQNGRQVIETVFGQPNVMFPAPGVYRLQFFAADRLARERDITVLEGVTPPVMVPARK